MNPSGLPIVALFLGKLIECLQAKQLTEVLP